MVKKMSGELFTVIGIGGLAFTLVFITWYVLQVIAYWKIFTKAGEPGWKSLIPFYNTFVQYTLTWNGAYGLLVVLLTLVNAIVEDPGVGEVHTVLMIVGLVITVVSCIGSYKLAKSFGKGAGFTVGLILLEPVFMLILGFGSAEYLGNADTL